MTALGAAVFGGFFGVAVLWLFLTNDESDAAENHQWAQDRSKSASCAAGPDRLSPMLVTHSSQK